jgi:hypothetical protein
MHLSFLHFVLISSSLISEIYPIFSASLRVSHSLKFPGPDFFRSDTVFSKNFCSRPAPLPYKKQNLSAKKFENQRKNLLQGNFKKRKGLEPQTERRQTMNQTNECAAPTHEDEELIDILIAISVVAKRLARQLQKEMTKEGDNHNGQNEGTFPDD